MSQELTANQPGTQAAPSPPPHPNGPNEQFFASINPGPDTPLAESCKSFAKAVLDYERVTEKPCFVLLHCDGSDHDDDYVSEGLSERIISAKSQIRAESGITLILH